MKRVGADSRGQTWTLRAALYFTMMIFAAIAIVGFTTGATIQSANSAKYDKYQTRQIGSDALEIAKATGELKTAVLYYQHETAVGPTTWHDAETSQPDDGFYTRLPTDHPLRQSLDQTLGRVSKRYNIKITFTKQDGTTDERRLVYQGTPGNDAVTTSTVIFLRDDDVIRDSNSDPVTSPSGTPCTLEKIDTSGDQCPSVPGAEQYAVPDAFPNTNRYNLVKVVITIW